MPLAGRKLSLDNALALCRSVGIRRRDDLITAVCVMTAESARYVRAYYENLTNDGVVDSTDRGLFQINSKWHPDLSEEQAYVPKMNARYAAGMSNGGRHWGAWAAFNSGRHEEFREEVIAAYEAGTWRERVPVWEGREG